MFWVAQFLGLIGTLLNVIAIQMKRKKHILLLFTIINLVFAINFALLGGYTGAIISFIASIQTIITYCYDRKGKAFPKALVPIYIIISFTGGLITYQSFVDILPIACAILYSLSIVQEKEKHLRFITFFNILLWLVYDFSVLAYSAAISDSLLICSTILAIFRYDILKKK